MKNTIDISTINRAASIIKNEVEFLRQEMAKLDRVKERISNAWTDTTAKRNAEKYLSALEDSQLSLAKKIDLFEDLAIKLENNAKRYSEMQITNNGGAV